MCVCAIVKLKECVGGLGEETQLCSGHEHLILLPWIIALH